MSIAEKYSQIKEDMQRAALHFYCVDVAADIPRYTGLYNEARQEFQGPEIIAVSKCQPQARINEALDAGLRHFGENKLQEAQDHWQDRRAEYPDLTLHMIGPIQSNKAAAAVALFDVIHSVDRKKIADALKSEMDKQQRELMCFIQVNIGEEPQKSGIMPAELGAFVAYCRDDLGLKIAGLMCIPPENEGAGLYFSLLKKYADLYDLTELSMGMSGDYQQSALLGASYVRIGTALMGAR
tara:strand:+ start:138293 stop:139009 length:717 start_codon:yes stop_codon:yes gene_type:complete